MIFCDQWEFAVRISWIERNYRIGDTSLSRALNLRTMTVTQLFQWLQCNHVIEFTIIFFTRKRKFNKNSYIPIDVPKVKYYSKVVFVPTERVFHSMNDLRPWRNPEQILPVSSFLLEFIHMKPLPQHFHMILYINFVVWV